MSKYMNISIILATRANESKYMNVSIMLATRTNIRSPLPPDDFQA